MRRTLKLWTSEGNKVRIVLDNWGSGLDHLMRRWTLEDGRFWLCTDSGELAHKSRSHGLKAAGAKSPVFQSSEPALSAESPSEPVADEGRGQQEIVSMPAIPAKPRWSMP